MTSNISLLIRLKTKIDKTIILNLTAHTLVLLLIMAALSFTGFLWLSTFALIAVVYFNFKTIYPFMEQHLQHYSFQLGDNQDFKEKFQFLGVALASMLPPLFACCLYNSTLTDGMQTNLVLGFFVCASAAFVLHIIIRLAFMSFEDRLKELLKKERLGR